jgi:hypothetical protein
LSLADKTNIKKSPSVRKDVNNKRTILTQLIHHPLLPNIKEEIIEQ